MRRGQRLVSLEGDSTRRIRWPQVEQAFAGELLDVLFVDGDRHVLYRQSASTS